MTFAGRYPPADPVKRGRFLAEREWWLEWRQKIPEGKYWVGDYQENFYKFLRDNIPLDADDYDQRIGNIITGWENTTGSEIGDGMDLE